MPPKSVRSNSGLIGLSGVHRLLFCSAIARDWRKHKKIPYGQLNIEDLLFTMKNTFFLT